MQEGLPEVTNLVANEGAFAIAFTILVAAALKAWDMWLKHVRDGEAPSEAVTRAELIALEQRAVEAQEKASTVLAELLSAVARLQKSIDGLQGALVRQGVLDQR